MTGINDLKVTDTGAPITDINTTPTLSTLKVTDQWPKLQEGYNQVETMDPDRIARIKKATQQFDIEPAFADKHLDKVEKAMQTPPTSFFEELERDYPGTTEFLSKPQNMAIAKDDLENLSFFERQKNNLKTGYQRGDLNVRQSELGWTQMMETLLFGEMSNTGEDELQSLEKQMQEMGPEPDISPLYYAAQQAPNFILMGRKAAERATELGVLGSMVPGVGSIAGAGLGGTIGVAEAGAILEGGSAFREFVPIQGVDPRTKAAAALVVGGINAGLEFVSLKALTKTIPGADKFMERFASKAPVLEKLTGKRAVINAMKNYLMSIGTEVGTEILQEATTATAGQLLQGEIKPKEIAERSAQVISPTIQSAALFGFPGTALNLGIEAKKAYRAQAEKKAYLAMGEAAKTSKTRERDAQTHREHIETVTKDSEIKDVYLPREAFQIYFQEKGIDPELVAQELGISEQYKSEERAGGDLQIDFATWVDKVVATEHYAALADDVKFDANGYTTKEWNAKQEGLKQEIEAEQAQAQAKIEENTALQKDYDEVYSYISEGMRQAGYKNNTEIDSNAKIWASHAIVESQRRGQTVQEWFQGINRPQVQQSIQPEKRSLFQKKENEVNQTEAPYKFPEIPVTRFDGELAFSKKPKIAEARKRAQKIGEKVKAQVVTNKGSEFDITISGRAIKKVAQHSASKLSRKLGPINQSLAVLEKLPELIENGSWETVSPDDKGRNKGYRYIFSPININGLDFIAKIEVRDTDQGYSYYTHDVVPAIGRAAKLEKATSSVTDYVRNSTTAGRIEIDLFRQVVNEKRDEYDFFQDDKESKRGAVSFPTPDSAVISIFKAKDQSTFIHESAHIWLKDTLDFIQKGEASEQYKQDWETLKTWLDFKDDQTEFTVEQQEKFARGFEAYVMEGKAPSRKLEKAFATFKKWLTRIYRTAKSLNVELTDDVRGVMDRMLATEQEIEEATQRLSTREELSLQGVPNETIAKLDTLRERAREKAEKTLLNAQMQELSKDSKKALDIERSWAREEITRQLNEEPIYIVMREIGDEFNTKNGQATAKKYLDGNMSLEDAERFEVIANFMGFGSGREMATVVTQAKPFKQALQEGIDSHMAQFADLKDTAAIKEKAMEAIHNEHSLELLALEEELLRQEIEGDVARQFTATQMKRKVEALRRYAKGIIFKKTYRDLSQLNVYVTRERDAAVKAAKAFANGDKQGAMKYKEQQVLNHALYREAVIARRGMEKSIKFLEKQRKAKRDTWNDYAHFEQASKLLERFGFVRNDFSQVTNEESLADWAKRMDEKIGIVTIPDWVINETTRDDYRNLKEWELRDIADSLRNIKKNDQYENMAFTYERGVTFDQVAEKLVAAQQESGKTGMTEPDTLHMTRLQKIAKAKNSANLSLLNVETLLRGLDRYKTFGEWWSAVYKPFNDAENVKARMLSDSADRYRQIMSVYSRKELVQMDRDVIDLPELNTKLTKMEILAMALNWGNETNRQRLLEGRNWTESQVVAVFDKHLEKRDWDTVQNIWDFINSYWGQISDLYYSLSGFRPQKVEANEVVTPYGTYKGGYYPLKADPRASTRAQKDVLFDVLLTEQGPTNWKAMTKNGHTQERVKGAKYKVLLDFSVAHRHLYDVIHDLTHRKAVIDLNRLLGREDVQNAIRDAYGSESLATIDQWKRDVAGENPSQSYDFLEKMWGLLRNNTIMVGLGMRITTMTQQLASYSQSTAVDENFKAQHAIKAIVDFYGKTLFIPGKYEQLRNFVIEKSAFMLTRAKNLDRDIAEANANIFRNDKRMQEFYMAGIQFTDGFVSIPIWHEAYKVGLEVYEHDEAKAIDYADMIVRRSQGSGMKKDLAQVMKGNKLKKLFTMFYSYMNTQYNLFYESYDRLKLDGNINQFAGRMMAIWIMPVVLSEILAFRAPAPDDPDENMKFWISKLFGYQFGLAPIARDTFTIALDKALGLKTFGHRATPATAMFEAGENVIGRWASDKAPIRSKLEATTKLASYAVPYPDQFNAWFWNAMDIAFGDMDLRFSDLIKRRPYRERKD